MTGLGPHGAAAAYRGCRVLVTGDTGFKGSWLCEWLLGLGAEVHGLGLPPVTTRGPALFDLLGLPQRLVHQDVDLRDGAALAAALHTARPQVVFHLAAQSLVREGYRDPFGTFASNVTGTLQLLQGLAAVASRSGPIAVVGVTSDKCYRNDGSGAPFAEDAPLGGRDPYSASKAMVELLASACPVPGLRLATARAGNVIGGGDRAADRLVVDAMHALLAGQPIAVRNPHAVRPWQHVLDPLDGYLRLGARLLAGDPHAAGAWNFGPGPAGERTVAELCAALVTAFGGGRWLATPEPGAPAEAAVLRLDAGKAQRELGWRPAFPFATAVEQTVAWYREVARSGNDPAVAAAHCRAQLQAHAEATAAAAQPSRRPLAGASA